VSALGSVRARADRKIVQVTVDGTTLPMPSDQIQCADMISWTGNAQAHVGRERGRTYGRRP
jgi:hypothetical protein